MEPQARTRCKMPTGRIAFSCSITLVVVSGAIANARDLTAEFPGKQTELASPDGKLKIVNHDPRDNDHPHTLVLTQPGHSEETIYSYQRRVRVGWDPKGRFLFITDYAESTNSTCIILKVEGKEKIDLLPKARDLGGDTATILSNPHAYLECDRWVPDQTLLVKAHGYGTSGTAVTALTLKYSVLNGFAPPGRPETLP